VKAIILIITVVFGFPDGANRAKTVVPAMYDSVAECKADLPNIAPSMEIASNDFAKRHNLKVKHIFGSCNDLSDVDYGGA
jgi:hypothetical protein